jgi:hypothetical protein
VVRLQDGRVVEDRPGEGGTGAAFAMAEAVRA